MTTHPDGLRHHETLAAQRLWRLQIIAADSGWPRPRPRPRPWPARSTPGGAIQVALAEGVSNGRIQGSNRIINQTKRGACRFRNMANYRKRIMVHIAVTTPRPTAA